MVIGRRAGNVIDMYRALRIFGDDVRLDRDKSSPVDLLRSFAEAFGLEFKIGGTPAGKFCLYRTISGSDARLDVSNASEGRVVEKFDINFFVKANPEAHRIEIALAFVTDQDAYRNSLAKRNVRSSTVSRRT
jgi:hypothetical protein